MYRNWFRHSEQFLYTTCSPKVLQKEELLIKIYLYSGPNAQANAERLMSRIPSETHVINLQVNN